MLSFSDEVLDGSVQWQPLAAPPSSLSRTVWNLRRWVESVSFQLRRNLGLDLDLWIQHPCQYRIVRNSHKFNSGKVKLSLGWFCQNHRCCFIPSNDLRKVASEMDSLMWFGGTIVLDPNLENGVARLINQKEEHGAQIYRMFGWPAVRMGLQGLKWKDGSIRNWIANNGLSC
jgi:hypothetical protein